MNVLITGASRGIGKAIAAAFAAEGSRLFLSSRNEVALYRCVEELLTRFPGAGIHARAFDLSRREEAAALGNWCLEQAVPDVLINNAGSFQPGNVSDEPEGLLEEQMAVNLFGAYHLTRSLLPAMMARRSGYVFNLCSVASLKAYANGGAYSISKHALLGFSRNLREEMKSYGIRVTTVLPGAVLTDSWSGFDNSSGRIMEAEDIAGLVLAATKLSPAACVEEILVRPQLGDL